MILRKVGLLLFVMLAASAALGRYGFFYGPGTWYTNAGDMGEQVRQRQELRKVLAPEQFLERSMLFLLDCTSIRESRFWSFRGTVGLRR